MWNFGDTNKKNQVKLGLGPGCENVDVNNLMSVIFIRYSLLKTIGE